MGVDLTLMPESFGGVEMRYSFHAIRMERQRELWAAIGKSGKEVAAPCPVRCHFARSDDGEICYGTLTETPYGTPLTFMMSGDLADLLSGFQMIGDNVWVLAMLNAMPREKPVYLYWS